MHSFTIAPPQAGYSADRRSIAADERRCVAGHAVDEYGFDEWALLHRHDPAAFDARRKALLALELAKADRRAADAARGALRRLEARLAELDDAQRVQTSMVWMAASLKLLGSRMQGLVDALGHPERPTA